MPERRPQPNGVLDPRLGISSKRATCETCGQMLADCTGHFGYIKLELPVFHIGYFRSTLQILQCVCKCCARVLLSDNERRMAARKFRNSSMERVRRENLFKKVLDRCKRVRICPHCGETNGPVKKAPSSLKLIHDQFHKSEAAAEEYRREFDKAAAANEALKANLKSVMDDLNPLRVQGLFKAIPDEDCELLDLAGRPEDLLVTAIPVPPVCIRPSVEMDAGAGSNEDDLTVKLMQIVEVNNILRQGLERGLPISNIAENWDFLQVQCAVYINSDLPGVTSMYQVPGKPTRGFVQRLKGKQGRFRGNLSGKRVDFSGRTVISPNPTLGVQEVGVPRLMAMTLTYPEKVTDSNLPKLQQRVETGASEHPGANFVVFPSGDKVFLKFGDRQRIAKQLKIGDVVERHLEDGDIVLFNRQPSLHRLSIMAHRVKVLEGRTLRFNECVCAPYNADFDGDEMNLHVPQTEEARAEARELLGVSANLSTPKSGEILVAATQDFLTASFLLTSKDTFLTRPDICRLASYFLDFTPADVLDLPPPAVVKPVEMWTGKQAFSLLLRPNMADNTFVTLETKEKIFGSLASNLTCKPCMDLADGYVLFRGSDLLCGRLGKSTLGGGNKAGLFQVLSTDYGPPSSVRVMNRLARLSAKLIGEKGFSIGIDDVTPADLLIQEKETAVTRGYSQCQAYIKDFQKGVLELAPGCDAVTSLENAVTGELNSIREKAAAACMKTLHSTNSPLIMSQCGSKGSPINIAQMVACVGQQSVGGSRAPNGFRERTLPHFKRGDRTPEGKGFVANSFYSGLEPTEFFFHTMAGREGLVDTAVKTAETGYMSRRLMKALEDLYVHYDGSVRNAAGAIMQAQYGDDSLDPVAMEGKDGMPIAFDRLFTLTSSKEYLKIISDPSENQGEVADNVAVLLPEAMEGHAKDEMQSHFVKNNAFSSEISSLVDPSMSINGAIKCSEKFYSDLWTFLMKVKERLCIARTSIGLKLDEYGAPELERLMKPIGFTRKQLHFFIKMCQERHRSKVVDPGSTVGAFGAQSIGEPGTQMTLKTFHFAGVASMNVTLGVPRIKEIINASRNIATPLMLVELEESKTQKASGTRDAEVRARLVKGRLEKTTLGEISSCIVQKCKANDAYLDIYLDMQAMEALQLDFTAFDIRFKLLESSKLKLKPNQVFAQAKNHLRIHPLPAEDKENAKRKTIDVFLQNTMNLIPAVVVSGISTVSRAVISHPAPGSDVKSELVLYVEGTGMLDVMGTAGVAGTRVKNNNIMEVASVLGIEAARATIIEQIQYTMSQHGMSIDSRHTMLLADCMTNRGEVLGITRFGIAKMKESVLMLASFEKTTDHLFDAALHGRVDKITGVSESIIMGIPMPTGTGMFKLVQKPNVPPDMQLDHRKSKVGTLKRRPDPILSSYF